jgi:hypothetical protein
MLPQYIPAFKKKKLKMSCYPIYFCKCKIILMFLGKVDQDFLLGGPGI